MTERRHRRRFPLQCWVEFDRKGHAFASATVNISSQGFYCVVDHPVSPGEELRCMVNLMQQHASLAAPGVSLNCDVLVLRTEERADGHGIACRIKNYTVLRPAVNGTRDHTRLRRFIQ